MLRFLCALFLLTSSLFAKESEPHLSCGCPDRDYSTAQEERKMALPGPVAGIATSMKCCPGLWTIGAAAIVVGVVAYTLSESVATGGGHLHS